MIPYTILAELRARIPVSEVVGPRVQLKREGREWKGLSPFNNERTPSFFVNDQKGFYHDFSSGKHGDIFRFVMETDGVTFPEAVKRLASLAGLAFRIEGSSVLAPSPCESATTDDHTAPHRGALQIWTEAVHPSGTPVIPYLLRRGLRLPGDAAGDAIRFHPWCKFGLRRLPCMVALVRNIKTDEPQAIQRTAIEFIGNEIKTERVARMALGQVGGGAVKLTDNADVTALLGVGEGIESTLSMQHVPEFGASPVWALLSAGQVAKFPVLAGLECLAIAVDNDRSGTGQRCALECSDRWTAAGCEVMRLTPTATGADLNNLIKESAE